MNEGADLEGQVVLAGFEGGGDALGEGIGVGGLDARGPGQVTLVAEEHVAVVGVDGAGEVFREHFRPIEAVDGVVGGGVLGGHRESEPEKMEMEMESERRVERERDSHLNYTPFGGDSSDIMGAKRVRNAPRV